MFETKSVDSVVKVFNKAISDLQLVINHHDKKATKHKEAAEESMELYHESLDEVVRAKNVVFNLQKVIGL